MMVPLSQPVSVLVCSTGNSVVILVAGVSSVPLPVGREMVGESYSDPNPRTLAAVANEYDLLVSLLVLLAPFTNDRTSRTYNKQPTASSSFISVTLLFTMPESIA